jgi:phage regulator Rha-like protein
MKHLIPHETIETSIFLIRGQKIMLSPHLAELYGIDTKYLNRAVKRNAKRFPEDFMFRLNQNEMKDLRCHFGTSRWGGRRYLPYAFTEQGVAMLSSVINSERAIQVNIVIMRAFVKLRQILTANKDLTAKLEELERRVGSHDVKIQAIFEVIKRLTMPVDVKKKEKIGFI